MKFPAAKIPSCFAGIGCLVSLQAAEVSNENLSRNLRQSGQLSINAIHQELKISSKNSDQHLWSLRAPLVPDGGAG